MRYLGRMTERPRNGNGRFLQKFESLYSKVNGEGLPIIHIPGKERILACLTEQLQVKKRERYPNISPSVSSRWGLRSPWSSSPPVFSLWAQVREYAPLTWIRTVSLHCLCVEPVGCVLRSHCLFLFPWLFSAPHEAFSLRSSGPRAAIKGLNLKLNYALLGQWSVSQIIKILLMTWQGESQPGWLEPGRGEGNVEMRRWVCERKTCQEPEGSQRGRGVVRGWLESDWRKGAQKVWGKPMKRCHQVEREKRELKRMRIR